MKVLDTDSVHDGEYFDTPYVRWQTISQLYFLARGCRVAVLARRRRGAQKERECVRARRRKNI